MDRGRQIDNVQNCNAVFIDKFGRSGKTSTRIINPPGGKDHFSLGWDEPPKQTSQQQKPQYIQQPYDQPQYDQSSGNKQRIERKKEAQDLPRNIPQRGYGKYANNQQISNIIFGNDDSNYEHYRK